MQDRASLYPGRVKLVPVAGQENTYDMVRADSPTQEGTQLNKDSLLKDATAALLGGDETMVPDEALVALKTMLDGISASSIGAARIELGNYTGTGVNAGTAKTLTFSFKPKVVIIAGPGSYVTSKFGTAIFMQGEVNSKSDIGGSSGSETVVGYLYDLTWSGNSVTWKGRGSSSAEYCLNKSGATYYYVAIG